MKIETLKIENLNIHEHHLSVRYSADEFEFSTKVFYQSVSFSKLKQHYSEELTNRIAAYVALFEGMKLCSLFPKYYDISPIAQYLAQPALELFVKIYQGVFGQHWYENQVTDYQQPEIIYSQPLGESTSGTILGNNSTILTGCGGGKDSVVAMKILEDAGLPFSSMQYSHSVYGKAELQHDLITEVVKETTPIKTHKISIIDDFLDFPLFPLYFPKNSGIIAPETPVSIFESLPLMLHEGYKFLSLAHERSANTGNLFWEELGKEVNHQWGKGFEAEQALNTFIQNHLLSNFTYFGILQPVYDFRIFKKLSQYPEILPKIHSCNIKKPWCKKCPKCAYVWLGLMSTFDPGAVDRVFGVNLFDDPDLLPIFRQMIGLEEHTPFECIGEIDESRLAMKQCLKKGLSGKALEVFKNEVLSDHSIDWQKLEEKYDKVYLQDHSIPDRIFQKIVDKF
ncbi:MULTISPECIES: hypothetical protein [unclassified Roseofilum]|uniref:hypothetical protein n=1 Tax=unclassified Roseofilum TaxID=2620099 RepID=UPI000E8FAF8D|nr:MULTISPECIES: hypothetical protein [unclassified Roseofilum]MBP0008674.1 hypothetical protein [Roseofilum sp. Belize Diploria]MBP0033083.1 hypothetical protein [Roseofilum sp. Belize BBD 4]HBR00456.1 hypothetical protein [Cyanobacteria bacterium UBA11691]